MPEFQDIVVAPVAVVPFSAHLPCVQWNEVATLFMPLSLGPSKVHLSSGCFPDNRFTRGEEDIGVSCLFLTAQPWSGVGLGIFPAVSLLPLCWTTLKGKNKTGSRVSTRPSKHQGRFPSGPHAPVVTVWSQLVWASD